MRNISKGAERESVQPLFCAISLSCIYQICLGKYLAGRYSEAALLWAV